MKRILELNKEIGDIHWRAELSGTTPSQEELLIIVHQQLGLGREIMAEIQRWKREGQEPEDREKELIEAVASMNRAADTLFTQLRLKSN